VSRLVTKGGKTYLSSAAYRNTGHGWAPDPGLCVPTDFAQIKTFDTGDQNPPMKDGLCPPIPFAGADITGNPIQFIDLDGDGYVDMIYSYKDKNGKLVTKVYFNEPIGDDIQKRNWVDAETDKPRFSKYAPPADIFPISTFGIGDMGVRFTKFDANKVGAIASFRAGEPDQCDSDGGDGDGGPGGVVCTPTVGALAAKAYSFDGNSWISAPQYAPQIPFVTQFDSHAGPSIDLFVQLLDINASGLPSLVANYKDPVTGVRNNTVYTNAGKGWVPSGITVPHALDAVYWEAKTLVQIVDVNGDGLPDIVMTNGDTPGNSTTWLGTGTGWEKATNWQVPADAISNKDGEPGFRLVDTKGDGFLDVIWMRPDKKNGDPDRGLALNNGHDWKTRKDEVVPKDVVFADADGVDQGLRLLSVTGKGLVDVVSSFGGTQKVYLNRGRRSDVLSSIIDGYGIKTAISYETLLEYDCSDAGVKNDCDHSGSGVKRNPLGWRSYERETPELYPKVSPVPTTYIVRQALVDQNDGKPTITFDYRYGRYQADANAARSLGFGWRETLNEFSKILTRNEMVQDARSRFGVAIETSCVVDIDALNTKVANAIAPGDHDKFPTNLCPSGDRARFDWAIKISEQDSCWNVVQGDAQGNVDEIQFPATKLCLRASSSSSLGKSVIRQSTIWKSVSTSFEVDGHLQSRSTDTINYDASGGVLDRHGDVLSTITTLDDGSSIETANEYADDLSRWLLGRLTKTIVTKKGDFVRGSRQIERRCSRFEYEGVTGLLSLQEINCGSSKSVTTRTERDRFGNAIGKTVSAFGEPEQKTGSEYDRFGRYVNISIDVLGHRSLTERDPTNGQPIAATDINSLVTKYGYDSFGRLRRQTSPTGIDTFTDLLDEPALPTFDGVHNLAWGLSVPVKYVIRSQTGKLPPNWGLFDAKGRQIRQATDGFTADATHHRFIFKESEYDSLGRLLRSSMPHDAADVDVRWTANEYDALGRICASTAINGLRTETLFVGRDEGGGTVTVVVDPRRQLSGPRRSADVNQYCPAGIRSRARFIGRTA
jgi:YD repeat-containing protein